ncbi:MAG: hypothetical protein JHD16_04600 [Solirubrobacteraceae bacterium]|nr:hypothetical protein [Solirubrobacteraceae bacterium]
MALDLADLARRAAEAGGEEAVASVSLRRELTVRATPDGACAPPRRTFDLLVRLMVRDGAGRIGVARCSTSSSGAQLQALAEQAHAQAAAARTDLRPLPDVGHGAGHEGFDLPTAALDPIHAAGAARQAAAAIGMAVGRDRSAVWRSETIELAVARSGGGDATDRRTGVQLVAEAVDGDGRLVGYAQGSAPSITDLAADDIGRRATPLALPFDRSGRPQLLGAHEPLILLAPAFAPLLVAFGRAALTGHSHAVGMSPYTGRAGLPVAPEGVTLTDAPRYLHTLARAIDVEGAAACPVTLIDDGHFAETVHDTCSAAEAGLPASTGHAGELGGTPSGAAPRNLLLAGGDVASVESLLMPVDHGVVIGAVDQVAPEGPGSTRFTAIGRAAYLVDRGTPVRLLGDVFLSGDVADVVASIDGLTTASELVARLDRLPERTTATSCPTALTAGVRVLV